MRKVRVGDECWEWTGATNEGYGQISVNNRPCRVHRLMAEHVFGPIPKGMLVCHSCDNRLCVNPAHLWLGTKSQNFKDMWAKGRGNPGRPRGSLIWTAKLTPADVIAIRGDKRPSGTVGRDYGVSGSAIRSIRLGKSWRHV